MVKLVIFDWDGTLMDSCPRIIQSVQSTANKMGLPVPSEDEVKGIIGISLVPAINILFPEADEQITQQIVQHYSDEYVHHSEVASPMFDGALSLLEKLTQNNIKLAVATGKKRKGLERVWAQSNTKHFFHGSMCADEAKSKPDPEMLVRLLEQFNLKIHEAVFVGDTKHDMKMADVLGMPRIGVTHGAGKREEIEAHGPDFIGEDLHQINQFLHTIIDRD